MEILGSSIDELCNNIPSKRKKEGQPCKNLEAERRRRKKLSDHLLALRSLVPIITNMNKATIIEDAITYIHALKNDVDILTQQLLEHDASPPFLPPPAAADAEEMKPCVKMENSVEVSKISEKKLWIKIIMEKKKGRFWKLLEATSRLGFELTHTTATTCKGTLLFSSFLQGTLTVEQTKECLLQIVRGI